MYLAGSAAYCSLYIVKKNHQNLLINKEDIKSFVSCIFRPQGVKEK